MQPSSPYLPCSALKTTSGRGVQSRKQVAHVPGHVDRRGVVAGGLERGGHGGAADQRDLALDRPAAHQHRHPPFTDALMAAPRSRL